MVSVVSATEDARRSNAPVGKIMFSAQLSATKALFVGKIWKNKLFMII